MQRYIAPRTVTFRMEKEAPRTQVVSVPVLYGFDAKPVQYKNLRLNVDKPCETNCIDLAAVFNVTGLELHPADIAVHP